MEKQLLQLPHVICIGLGKKAEKEVIKVFVKKRTPDCLIQLYNLIPETLEGYEIEIEEIGEVNAQECLDWKGEKNCERK